MSETHGFRRIAVLYGGRGAEHDISVLSAASVLASLHPVGDDIVPVLIEKSGRCLRTDTLTPVYLIRQEGKGGLREEGGRFLPIDVALPVLHGDHGEDGEVQGWLRALGIPFVGADVASGAACCHKIFTKRLARDAGIPILPFAVLSGDMTEKEREERLSRVLHEPVYPLFIKPADTGSSVGTSLVTNPSEIAAAVNKAAAYGDVLAEPYVYPVRELEIGWLGGSTPMFSEVAEVKSAGAFYDFHEKYKSDTAEISLPADIPADVKGLLYRYAERLVDVLAVRDLCRLDFFYTSDGRVFFNEVNTFPGCTRTSLFPAMWERIGISPSVLWETLVNLAYDRGV